jgi:hydrogenase maturation protease/hydrogenase 3 maturation protease
MASEAVGILCIGNALHGDDGLGEAVWTRLSAARLPPHVRLACRPFVAPAVLTGLEDCARLIVVDALQGFGVPGSVHRLRPQDITAGPGAGSHGAGLGQWLAQLDGWFDPVPQVEIVGAELQRMAPFSPGLSPAVAAAVAPVCECVLECAGHA